MPWKPDYKFGAEYMGGHKAFPKKKDTDLLIFHDRIILDKMGLEIPFRSMTNIENSDAERLTKTRMFLTPFFIGFFWKKRYLYTVIDYHDGIDKQTVILDLHKSVEKAQAIIYQRMLSSKDRPKCTVCGKILGGANIAIPCAIHAPLECSDCNVRLHP
jgi:hypothetical protein